MPFSKKGTEMSINVLVGIILGLIMLSSAMFLFFKIMAETEKTSAELDEQTRNKIIQALDTGEPVYIPITNLEAKKDGAIFWVGIKNTGSQSQKFMLDVKIMPGTNVPNFVAEDIAFMIGPYEIAAKDNVMPPVAVNMKGVTSKVTLLVNVSTVDANGLNPVQYAKPKIVYIEP